MQEKRRIAVYTGNRTDYGLQYPALRAIARDSRLEYFLLVSGAHLKEDFGGTFREIEADGFRVYKEIPIEMEQDTLFSVTRAIGSGILNLSPILNELQPHFLLAYADRFESFSAVVTSTQMGIVTAHGEGGDYTEGGALDDSVRHAMTKLAHLHFVTNAQSAERVLRLGEESWRVFNVGYPGLDLIATGEYASPGEIYRCFDVPSGQPILVFTQHSVATEFDQAGYQVRPSLEALDEIGKELDCVVIITYPNDDAGGRRIIAEIEALALKKRPYIRICRSLGRYYYYGVLNVAAACVGNSSSGIKETPAFHCPCVNIGTRQHGRLRADNVLDVGYNKEAIKNTVRRCFYDEEFKGHVQTCENPYGTGETGLQIAEILATIPIDAKLLQKRMTY